MRKKREIIALFTLLALFICMLPNVTVKAVSDVNIVSSTNATVDQAKKWAKSKGATDTFINLADLYWKYSSQHGNINPALAYVQAAKETGYGKFGGVLDESFHNPCGMKVTAGGGDYEKEAHQKFATWDEGVQAHLDHLALYAGAKGYPRTSTPDPRHFDYLLGKAKTALALTGNWTGGTYGEDLVKLYNELTNDSSNTTTKPSMVTIDSPWGTQSVSGNTLTVSGWALSEAGIKEVKVYVDGKLKNSTTSFYERNDVVQAYPGYTKTTKPGFNSKVNISDITVGGIKNFTVEVVDNNGKSTKANSSFKLNKLENLVTIDSPWGTQSISGDTLTLKGWALTTSGIREVKVYVDGKLKNSTTDFYERNDVLQAYPSYKNTAKPGFTSKVNISDITSGGVKNFTVEVIDNNGNSTKANSSFKLNKLENMVTIDSPWGTQSVSGDTLTVSGWALSTSGIKEVKVYVDGKLKNSTTNFYERNDVVQAYPGYTKTTKPGFTSKVNILDLTTGGLKNLAVEVVANDGAVVKANSSFKLNKLENLVTIDSPWGTQSVSGQTLTVRGWSLTTSGIKEVKVYVDGKLKNSTTNFYERNDVVQAYPGYTKTTKPGFTSKVNISDLTTGGIKNLAVEVVANDGTVVKANSSFKLNKLDSIVTIDSPWGTQSVRTNKLTVSGWALSSAGVKEVKIYIDGKLQKSTTSFYERRDVIQAYPMYSHIAKPGFTSTVDLSNMVNGFKKLEVEVINNDGSSKKASSTFKLDRLNTIINIDNPWFENSNSNTLSVRGWAISYDEVSEVKVYIDGTLRGTTKSLYARTDVNNAYPDYKNSSKPGFAVDINMSNDSAGTKKLLVVAVLKDGSTHKYEQNFRFKTKATIGCIDSPNGDNLYKDDTLLVSGWMLSDVDVSKVNVYVDDVLRGTTLSKVKRDDVVKVYPGYKVGANCGYSLNIHVKDLAAGAHTLKVEGINSDGGKFEQKVTFYYKMNNKLIVLDPGHNIGKDDGAYSLDFKYSERKLNDEIAVVTKAKLEAKGYKVIYTRNPFTAMSFKDINDSLAYRANLANSLNPQLFISIHQNAYDNEAAHGTEVYYTTNTPDSGFPQQDREKKVIKSKSLSEGMSSRISSVTGMYNRGSKDGNLFVLRNTKMPAVLVECGFVTNPGDAQKLSDSSYQNRIAQAIADSVGSNF